MAHDFEQRLLVLRTMAAIRAYLDSYPIAPAESADISWLTEPEWLAEGDDADEDRFHLAVRLSYPAVRLRAYDERGASDSVTPELARRMRAVPLQNSKGLVAVALEDCENPEALQQLNFLLRDRVLPMIATPRTIRECIGHFYDHDQDLAVARQLGLDPLLDAPQRDMERLARERPVVRIVTDLISEAVARRASDIHIRPGEQGADALYRIDDELVAVRRFMRALLPAVVSRIKVLGEMNLAEHRKPQDGRSSFVLDNGRKVDLRISVMPAVFGESVVIRLLDT
ncbi:MAG: Flp pilus assembly complex ATPase component TadA, partial [Xanthomonadales bacterium]|nr:Flp pilus assembly complex ATPase component TadA [Xanthomonadales bacterium]